MLNSLQLNRKIESACMSGNAAVAPLSACATGAAATVVAGVLEKKLARKVTVHLLGGALEVEWSEKDNCVRLSGPANESFSGNFEWSSMCDDVMTCGQREAICSVTVPAETRKEWIRSRRQRKKVARRARFRRQMVRYMVLCCLLVLGWSGFTKLPWILKHGPEDIVVHGNQVATVEQVRNSIANVGTTPLYRLNPRQLEKQIVGLKAVKYAFVRRYALPQPRIVVEVLEEFPWASFSQGPESPTESVIAQSGRMIPVKDFPTIGQPKLIFYGRPGSKLDHSNVAQWAKWVAYISEQTGSPVDYVDLRNSNDVRIQNGDLHLKLGIADTTLLADSVV